MNDEITVITQNVTLPPVRETAITIPAGSTMMEVYNALGSAEGSGFRITNTVILVFRYR